MGYSYSGAKGNIKVFNPYIESIGAYSSSQIMLRSGPLQTFETAEAGWAVNPIVYNDQYTRLFAYWTVDGMQNTGCFDLTCPGFVQTSRDVTLGMDIGSFYGSEITIQISKDPQTSNWWLKYNDKEVGYWPADIFETMRHQAVLVQWGGEVYSPKVGTSPHTATNMASGEFADPITETSGKVTGMLVEQNSNPPKRPEPLYARSDEWNCYDAYILKEYVPEPILYYGGPGSRNNPKCS
ncbi:protein neprosin-like [Bidens hawaiensis]|uniref:protein neprosin-like n=1 Tax=Bidens hawaiensis TaxID=980011 RepID=UPI00404A9EC4